MRQKGIYCLVFRNPGVSLGIGSLGSIDFSPGWHIYVGSALGSGGFSRVKRHIALHLEKSRSPRWHVDYLLLSSSFSLSYTFCGITREDLECTLAEMLGGDDVEGFGCSDCSCRSHLFYREKDPSEEIVSAFGRLGLPVQMKKIK